jgi:KaiC/GvpD/RAD55 family RecA-like ATPase
MDKIVKATLDTYFPEADTVFYHKAGLIRVGYTINNKSGLYKTPMTWDELKTLDVEAIKVLASKPRRDLRFKRVTVEPFLHELIQTAVVTGLDLKKIPMDQPGKVVTCVQTMYSRGEEIGTRHLRMMAMVSSWRRSGIPLAGVIEMLKGWAPSLDEAEIIRHATDIYNKGYQYGCDHKQMKEFCSPTCNYYANKDYSADVLTGKDMEKQLVKMARTSYKDRGINLKDVFEIDKDFWIYPGYTVNIIGDTGLNKTAFCQNLALAMGNLSPVLYCSTEFSNIMLFRRFTQIAHDMTKEQVMAYYAEHDNTLSNAFSHIHYLEVVPNIDEVRNLISRFSPKVVFIDTIDDITVKGQKGLDAEVTVATQMKIMAEALDTIIVYVHHIRKDGAETTNREGEVKSKALSLRDGKGSGAYNQKADVVLAIEGDRNQTGRKVSVLKARDDMPFRIAFNVDMDTFKFNQIIL